MEMSERTTLVMIPSCDLEFLKTTMSQILIYLQDNKKQAADGTPSPEYILAASYMKAVGIRRTKFFGLISEGKIKSIKKCRKIYVHASEITRFFNDPSIG
ncbi:hypothetical protein PV783_14060 [Chitinophaga sp. CC14]|uniref:hypothetical protein n=1 Tax=Chitinophaga sp. CC14 TaxID=3029199 RepID=UPI003B7ADEB5